MTLWVIVCLLYDANRQFNKLRKWLIFLINPANKLKDRKELPPPPNKIVFRGGGKKRAPPLSLISAHISIGSLVTHLENEREDFAMLYMPGL